MNCDVSQQKLLGFIMHKKMKFSIKDFSVNMTKSQFPVDVKSVKMKSVKMIADRLDQFAMIILSFNII